MQRKAVHRIAPQSTAKQRGQPVSNSRLSEWFSLIALHRSALHRSAPHRRAWQGIAVHCMAAHRKATRQAPGNGCLSSRFDSRHCQASNRNQLHRLARQCSATESKAASLRVCRWVFPPEKSIDPNGIARHRGAMQRKASQSKAAYILATGCSPKCFHFSARQCNA